MLCHFFLHSWNGNTMTLSACDGTVLESAIGANFVAGFGPVARTVCLPPGLEGLVVGVGGGTYPSEVLWTVTLPSGAVLTGGVGTASSTCPVVCEDGEAGYTVALSDSYGDG